VDGLRPDAIKQAKVPNLDGLIKRGASTMHANTVIPSLTLPAITSLLSGLTVEQHGVTWNDYEPQRGYLKAPTVFELAAFQGSKRGALFINKNKLLYIAKPDRMWTIFVCAIEQGSDCTGRKIAEEVFTQYKRATEGKPEFFLVHIAGPDLAGHNKGWMSKPYLQAVEECDRAIGILVKGFQSLGLYDRTAFIVTADHGGHGTTHGTGSPEDMTIPWIAAGPGIKKGYEIKRTVSILDTPATIMQAFGITDYYVEWGSRSVDEIFEGGKVGGSGAPNQ
jgi:predicted AlkP superfamily pyrophosphatase or phosphodiesterase